MRFEAQTSVLTGFDFKLLEDPEFQEDSVREEIVVPVLRGLGYTASKPNKIIRSKKLVHPFVSIGSASKKIHLVPDYLLEVNDKFAWILECKAPSEEILNTKHVEQAYSYAIHSEVRVPYFALCNGKEFVLYHVSKAEPILHFPMRSLPLYWPTLASHLHPEKVLDVDLTLRKDFGLHLKRLGFHEFSSLTFPGVPIRFLGQITEDHFMFGSGIKMEERGDTYVVTFDFNRAVLHQLRGKIPEQAYRLLLEPMNGSLKQIQFADVIYFVDVDCRVGTKLEENQDEIFLPLWVNKFM